jgi:hypothetical protein
VDIKELYTTVNTKVRDKGYPKLDIERWIEEISYLEAIKLVNNDNGDISSNDRQNW